ncbi:MAG: class I SAM-dependent methyltransferase [Proteobacteria bacterium]|nr:MAG: class I SAM-dependent methyltransferase [Pseudomonadota bacterium]
MIDAARRKWDRAARTYDFVTRADERRYGRAKQQLFETMHGRCLMLAVGTGHDLAHCPPGLTIHALDISRAMLERAREPAAHYPGRVMLVQMDARRLAFRDATFDSIATVCTFCSVPDPVVGLRELHRVLKPDGRLLLFEHVRSRVGPIAMMQDLLTPLSRRLGPDLNRDTFGNVARAGFRVVREENVYLDIVKAGEAVRGVG